MNWDQSIPGGKCGNQATYYISLGLINIVVEVVMLAIPLPVLYKLHMPPRKNVVIISMFSIGFSTCAITIYRQATLSDLQFADMTHSGVVATLLSGLEPSVALALACVPFLRSLFGNMFASPNTRPKHLHGRTNGFTGERKHSGATAFEALQDDCSELQLHPTPHVRGIQATSISSSVTRSVEDIKSDGITVHRQWEVTTN